MSRRNFWLALEIKCMLKIFKEFKVLHLLEQKILPVHDIYKGVEREMIRRGYNTKNARQIQNKWSQLKSTYLCAKRNHNPEFYSSKDLEFRDDVGELIESQENLTPVTALNTAVFIDKHGDFKKTGVEEPIEKLPAGENLFKQGSYKKTFFKFLQHVKSVERDIQDDFVNRQRKLYETERKMQLERNLQILNAFINSTDSILKTSNFMLSNVKESWNNSIEPEYGEY